MQKQLKKPATHKTKTRIAAISLALSSLLFSTISFAEETASTSPVIALPKTTSLPPQLNAEFIFRYLAAEIAGQRGELGLSTKLFYELARTSRDPRLAERAAKVAIFSQNPSMAMETTKLWVELSPDSTEAQQASTQINVMTGNLTAAKPYLQKLLAKDENPANGFLYLNSLLAHQANKQAVLELVQALAEPYQNLAEARLSTSQAAFQAGNFPLALTEINAANQLRPNWELGAIQQADILSSLSPTEAINFYKGFLSKNENANDARLNLARMLIKQQRYGDAKPELLKLSKLADTNPEILVVVGLLSTQSNDLADAEQYFKQALNTNIKDKNQIYLYLGQLAEKNKHDDEAIKWYGLVNAPQKDSQTPQADYYLDAKISQANVMARTAGTDAAIAMLDDLQDLSNPQLALVISAQANLLVQAKRVDAAYDLLSKAVANMPDSPDLIYDHAMAAERVKQFGVLETQLRKLIKIKPQFAQAYNALGYSFADRNIKLDEANKLITKALALSPNDHYIMDSMGWVLYRQGKLDKAYEYLSAAYAAQNDAEIAAHLGEVLWQQGKHEEAIELWDSALKSVPDNEVLSTTIKKFKR